jgi:hypothetical protein
MHLVTLYTPVTTDQTGKIENTLPNQFWGRAKAECFSDFSLL